MDNTVTQAVERLTAFIPLYRNGGRLRDVIISYSGDVYGELRLSDIETVTTATAAQTAIGLACLWTGLRLVQAQFSFRYR